MVSVTARRGAGSRTGVESEGDDEPPRATWAAELGITDPEAMRIVATCAASWGMSPAQAAERIVVLWWETEVRRA